MQSPTLALLLLVALSTSLTVVAHDGYCHKQISALLGAKNDKYLLFGLTTDCHLFFARNIPNDTDLGEWLEGGISTQAQDYCYGGSLIPMKNSANEHLSLVRVMYNRMQKLPYVKLYDFPLPTSWSAGETFMKTQEQVKLNECTAQGCYDYAINAFTSPDMKTLFIPLWITSNTETYYVFARYQLQDDQLYHLDDSNRRLNKNFSPISDIYKSKFYQFPKYNGDPATMCKWQTTSNEIPQSKECDGKIYGISASSQIRTLFMANGQRLGIHYNGVSPAQLFIQTIGDETDLLNNCIMGTISNKGYAINNFQMGVLMNTYYDDLLEQINPSTITTTTVSTTTTSTTTTTTMTTTSTATKKATSSPTITTTESATITFKQEETDKKSIEMAEEIRTPEMWQEEEMTSDSGMATEMTRNKEKEEEGLPGWALALMIVGAVAVVGAAVALIVWLIVRHRRKQRRLVSKEEMSSVSMSSDQLQLHTPESRYDFRWRDKVDDDSRMVITLIEGDPSTLQPSSIASLPVSDSLPPSAAASVPL